MKLFIDGYTVEPQPGQSLLDMVQQLGLSTGKLSTDPLAAKIATQAPVTERLPSKLVMYNKLICFLIFSIKKSPLSIFVLLKSIVLFSILSKKSC